MPDVIGYGCEQKNICAQCGGKCCLQRGCTCVPGDFDNDIKKMKKALLTGNFSIGIFGPEDRIVNPYLITERGITLNRQLFKDGQVVLSIASRELNARILDDYKTWFFLGEQKLRPIVDLLRQEADSDCICALLTPKGCKLDFSKRPRLGRILVPVFDRENCYIPNRKAVMEELLKQWAPYFEGLLEIARELEDKSWDKSRNFYI
jgi:hypothetical protein